MKLIATVGFAIVGFAAAFGGTIIFVSPRDGRMQELEVDIGAFPAYSEDETSIAIRAPRSFAADRIVRISSTCGCITAPNADEVEQSGNTLIIPIRVVATSRDEKINTSLYLHTNRDNRFRVKITGEILAPFDGWPRRAEAIIHQTDSRVFLELNPPYLENIKEVWCFSADVPVSARLDHSRRGIIFEPPEGADELELALRIGRSTEGLPNWSGPLIIQDESEHRDINGHADRELTESTRNRSKAK
ncbi:MAG: hypothetical protein EA376_02300 [Phycisphaeraceae bacterium]|nr:MAG: hypothetical protein EA376_02300 [Phycisphaeraceae bacterium]